MSSEAWILIAAIAAVVLVALVVGFVRYRSGRVSLTAPTEDKELTDKSGGYKASGGFSFSQGGTATATRPEPLPAERTDTEGQPHVGDDAAIPRDAPRRGITNVPLPEPTDLAEAPAGDATTAEAPETTAPETAAPEAAAATAPTETAPAEATPTEAETVSADTAPPAESTPTAPAVPDTVAEAEPAPALEEIEPTAGRLVRLRGRLSRSQNAVGKSLLGLLGGGDLDEDSWEEVEDTLVLADLGTASTAAVVERLREEMAARSVRTTDQARAVLRDVLVEALRPELDRSVRALPHPDHPSILLVVGVNGTGKTTTTGKLARVLVADGRRVLLGAADTFRAAAADQLQTWGERVGADTVRGKEGADPAAVAFDAVAAGIDRGVDAVLIDTAGRLHTKTGLMDELGKVKRVVEKKAAVDEVLLVLDATVGQNGLMQARVFAEVVDITGVVLTKLDGTAKGGIVFQVQHELGVPVKLVGLGEGADDLAPFEPGAFVDALLG
ncbi:signal recognition particle-docking protein FtsY [Nocardia cyriacigeorgica]|uniref:signal recognition particle-docking protein FtsY n=1 Tax=Nocardia cyriacigeorgica TaxID=135487 RepID=UPI001892F2BF|nr:signal recognition particle-docking protein FtsY [Nocardia cyriacigeorgica]MBF6089583.1 signal recognition particle-docking protein FtsY [Nocardia cyriacigeorgica]MBF6094456.1 signal recognition particle-docking protein FtsY [Nocardia cyriacigeorgica]MBF6316476.1 signal recognition particle-docking protein FtsY [Nocardia cyriacigeorgica]MBF6534793.1 signal recognition particle-docking protein FtsY [Nocardia cyriacigeorgica]